jgi:adenine deaminase
LGRALDAYLAAGVESDHECTRPEEASERRRKGMWVFIRQGSASQNLAALIGEVLAHGPAQVALCTDDREPDGLLREGHINHCARLASAAGVPEADVLLLACTHPARYHGFTHLGDLGPGRQADVLAFAELGSWRPDRVWQAGRLVAAGGVLEPGAVPDAPVPGLLRDTVHVGGLPDAAALGPDRPAGTRVRAVGVVERSISTRACEVVLGEGDVARAAVVERHHGSGRVGTGYATGFGLRRGALASTVAHDAHNVVVLGALDADGPRDMAVAVARLAELGGGQVAVVDGAVVAEVALPLAGLMSDRPAAEVAERCRALNAAAAGPLGVTIDEPFMQLSFIALSVIPELRITDGGLVDVGRFERVPVEL